ncbi:MAG: hypothetical protein U0790_03475 [Isosphaeraceae bacterium]
MIRRSTMAILAAFALSGLLSTPASAGTILFSMSPFTRAYDGSSFFLGGTIGSRSLDLTFDVAQTVDLDYNNGYVATPGGPVYTGTTFSTLGINNSIFAISRQDFSFDSSTATITLAAAAPIVFDLGGGLILTVTPIESTQVRRATFLLSIPEPSSMVSAVMGSACLLVFSARRRARTRPSPTAS